MEKCKNGGFLNKILSAIDSKDIIYNFNSLESINSVDDFTNIPMDKPIVLSGENGGIFYYDQSKKDINNGKDIFKGWVKIPFFVKFTFPIVPLVSGDRKGNKALESLLEALASIGIITNNTTGSGGSTPTPPTPLPPTPTPILDISKKNELYILVLGQSNIANYLSTEFYMPSKDIFQLGLDGNFKKYKSPIVTSGEQKAYTIDGTNSFYIDWGITQNWEDGEKWIIEGDLIPNGKPRSGIVGVSYGTENEKKAYTLKDDGILVIEWGDKSRYIDGEEFIVDGNVIPNGLPRKGVLIVEDVTKTVTKKAYTLGGNPSIGWNDDNRWIDGEEWYVVGTTIPNGKPRSGKISVIGETVTKKAYTLGGSPSIGWNSDNRWIDGEEWYVVGTTIPNGKPRSGKISVTTTTHSIPHTSTVNKTAYTISAGANFSLPLGSGWKNGEVWYAQGTVAPGKVARSGKIYTDANGNPTQITLDNEGQYVQNGIGTSGTIRGKSSGKTANWSGAIVIPNGTYSETITTYTTETTTSVSPKAISSGKWTIEDGQYIESGVNTSGKIKGKISGAIAYYSGATIVENGTYQEVTNNKTVSPKAISSGKWTIEDGQYIESGVNTSGKIKGKISGAIAYYSNATIVENGTYSEDKTTKQLTDLKLVSEGQYIKNGIGESGTFKTSKSNLTINYHGATIVENGTYGGVNSKSVFPKEISQNNWLFEAGQYIENGIGSNGIIKGVTSGSIAHYYNAKIVENGTYGSTAKQWDLASGDMGNYLGRLGDKLIDAYPNLKQIYFCNVAVGGTKIDWWVFNSTDYPLRDDDKFPYQEGKLFERVIFVKNKMEQIGKKIDMVLFHQGESDGVENTSKDSYKNSLKSVFESIIQAVGKVPIFCSKASYAWGTVYPQIISAQEEIINEMDRVCLGVETDKFGSIYRHDDIHFNQLGMDKITDEWVTKIKTCNFNNTNSDKFDFDSGELYSSTSLTIPSGVNEVIISGRGSPGTKNIEKTDDIVKYNVDVYMPIIEDIDTPCYSKKILNNILSEEHKGEINAQNRLNVRYGAVDNNANVLNNVDKYSHYYLPYNNDRYCSDLKLEFDLVESSGVSYINLIGKIIIVKGHNEIPAKNGETSIVSGDLDFAFSGGVAGDTTTPPSNEIKFTLNSAKSYLLNLNIPSGGMIRIKYQKEG